MEDKVIEGIAYAIPALVCGAVAYFMFSAFLRQDSNEMKFNALVGKKRESLPMKLQAYVNPIGTDTNSYLHLLIANMEQEFEHNLVQQIYVTEDTWKAVVGSKLAIINKFREVAEKSSSANELRENLLIDYSKIESPTETAVEIIKRSVRKLL